MPTTTSGLPRLRRLTLALAALALLAPAAAIANGPFGPWLTLPGNAVSAGPGHGFIQIAHNAALNPAGDVTFEMWVRLQLPFVGPAAPESCRSLLGKNYNDTSNNVDEYNDEWPFSGRTGQECRAYRGSGSNAKPVSSEEFR